jgi:hypothetical protein
MQSGVAPHSLTPTSPIFKTQNYKNKLLYFGVLKIGKVGVMLCGTTTLSITTLRILTLSKMS